jgi:hypothetical protein
VAMWRKGDRFFAQMAGGNFLEVNKEEYDLLSEKLEEHLLKHVFNK